MDEFDCNMLRCAIRELASVNSKKKGDIADLISARLQTAMEQQPQKEWKVTAATLADDVDKFVSWQSVKGERLNDIAPFAVEIVFEHRKQLLPRLNARSPALENYMVDILQRYHPHGSEVSAEKPKNTIFDNWQRGNASTDDLVSGIYQVYRRHKPVPEVENPLDHTIVTELVRIDTTAKKCILVDSDGDIHQGTLHINSMKMAFFLYQHSLGSENNFEYRFYCQQLENRATLYSSLCIRIGDVSGRPAMSECFSKHVGHSKNPELYEAFDALSSSDNPPAKVPAGSIILDYIAPAPKGNQANPDWPIRYVKEFPFFSGIIDVPNGTLKLFQEPIRAMNKRDVFEALLKLKMSPPGVFRHSEWQK